MERADNGMPVRRAVVPLRVIKGVFPLRRIPLRDLLLAVRSPEFTVLLLLPAHVAPLLISTLILFEGAVALPEAALPPIEFTPPVALPFPFP